MAEKQERTAAVNAARVCYQCGRPNDGFSIYCARCLRGEPSPEYRYETDESAMRDDIDRSRERNM